METFSANEPPWTGTGRGDRKENATTVPDAPSIIIVLEAALMVLILVENGLIIFCFLKNQKLRRNITNYYLIQLTLSDFFTGLFTGFHIAVQVNPTLLTLEYACLARYCSMMLVCSISLFSILLITYDRFVAIFRPFFYRSHVSKKRVITKCLIIYVFPIIVCLIVPLVWRKNLNDKQCLMIFVFPFEYLAYMITPMYLATVIFKFSMYIVIFNEMAKRYDRAKKMVQNRSRQSIEQLERISRSTIALTKTGAMVLVSFTLCWTPFFVHLIIQLVGVKFSVTLANTISLATFMMILLNSALNPVIYVLRLPYFWNELKRVICKNSAVDEPERGGSLWDNHPGGTPRYRGSLDRCGIYFLHSRSVLHRGRMANRLRDKRRQSGETLLSYRKRSDESVESYQFLWQQQTLALVREGQCRDMMQRSLSCPPPVMEYDLNMYKLERDKRESTKSGRQSPGEIFLSVL